MEVCISLFDDICSDDGNDKLRTLIVQANVRVLVNSWHVKRSSSSWSHCCRTSTSNLPKDRILLMSMKFGEEQMSLLLMKLEWLQGMQVSNTNSNVLFHYNVTILYVTLSLSTCQSVVYLLSTSSLCNVTLMVSMVMVLI